MGRLWEVAPPATWGILTVAATLLLAGFVLLSHSLVRRKAHGDRYTGIAYPGRLEWTFRVGAGCLLLGLALWAVELAAPVWVVAALGGLAAVAFGLEAVAFTRR